MRKAMAVGLVLGVLAGTAQAQDKSGLWARPDVISTTDDRPTGGAFPAELQATHPADDPVLPMPPAGQAAGHSDDSNVLRVGGSVTPPVVLRAPNPEFSKEARKAHVGGTVLVYLQVGADGKASKVRVLKGVGFGLDEKAVEAVSRYEFKPATRNGQPVAVEINVQVNFAFLDRP